MAKYGRKYKHHQRSVDAKGLPLQDVGAGEGNSHVPPSDDRQYIDIGNQPGPAPVGFADIPVKGGPLTVRFTYPRIPGQQEVDSVPEKDESQNMARPDIPIMKWRQSHGTPQSASGSVAYHHLRTPKSYTGSTASKQQEPEMNCKVGDMRARPGDLTHYEECVHRGSGMTGWMMRQCPPGMVAAKVSFEMPCDVMRGPQPVKPNVPLQNQHPHPQHSRPNPDPQSNELIQSQYPEPQPSKPLQSQYPEPQPSNPVQPQPSEPAPNPQLRVPKQYPNPQSSELGNAQYSNPQLSEPVYNQYPDPQHSEPVFGNYPEPQAKEKLDVWAVSDDSEKRSHDSTSVNRYDGRQSNVEENKKVKQTEEKEDYFKRRRQPDMGSMLFILKQRYKELVKKHVQTTTPYVETTPMLMTSTQPSSADKTKAEMVTTEVFPITTTPVMITATVSATGSDDNKVDNMSSTTDHPLMPTTETPVKDKQQTLEGNTDMESAEYKESESVQEDTDENDDNNIASHVDLNGVLHQELGKDTFNLDNDSFKMPFIIDLNEMVFFPGDLVGGGEKSEHDVKKPFYKLTIPFPELNVQKAK